MKKTLAVLAITLFSGTFYFARSASAQSPAQTPAPAEKTAGEVYKNVQVLKDVPASEFTNGMWFIAGSLGVPCQHCHTAANESDDKQAKLTARKMIQMTRDLNAANFGGKQVVTCNTCHQGSIKPNGVPKFWGIPYTPPDQIAAYVKERQPSAPSAAPAPAATPAAAPIEILPSVETILANYRKAIGSTPITSIHLTAEVDADLAPQPTHIEINRIFPDKIELAVNTPAGPARQILNGDHGWIITPAGTSALTPAQIAGLKANANQIASPFKILNPDSLQKVIGIEKIGDHSYYVVESHVAKNRILFYFDTQTGLLHKSHLEVTTPLGTYPADTVYEDFRETNGIKMPYLMVGSGTSGGARNKFTDIQINVPVDPKKFDPPPATPPK